jgi:SAM-dependent methyltransferase
MVEGTRGALTLQVTGYVYDQSFEGERARLAGMEAQWDPGTFRHIDALDLGSDASCWEIGAGGGSVAAWLAARFGRVLVTDVDIRFVEELQSETVTVMRHDVAADPPPEDSFDLIHARLVLEHLPGRDQVLEQLARRLRPGGWLLIEDYDWTSYGADPSSALVERVSAAILDFMTEAGFDPYYGRRLMRELEARGLTNVDAEGRMLVMGPEHPGRAFYRLSLVSLREAVVARGAVTDADVDEALGELDREDRTLLSPAMVAGWGQAPG